MTTLGILRWFRERVGLQEPEPEPAPPPEDMHWRPTMKTVEVACGAEGVVLFTAEPGRATCAECRRIGALWEIRRVTNYR